MTNANDSPLEDQHHETLLNEQRMDRIVGRRLTRLREAASLTLDDVHALSGIPEEGLTDHERGEIPLPITRLTPIATALGMTPESLLRRLLCPLS